MSDIITRFKQFYDVFDDFSVDSLSSLYASDVVFKDPVHQIKGLDALADYFRSMGEGLKTCLFQFDNELIGAEVAWFQWTMSYQHERIAGGKLLHLNGASKLDFAQERIVSHEDFYDMGAMLYQHLPILGRVVKHINKRLAG